jgi:hypothetical protein
VCERESVCSMRMKTALKRGDEDVAMHCMKLKKDEMGVFPKDIQTNNKNNNNTQQNRLHPVVCSPSSRAGTRPQLLHLLEEDDSRCWGWRRKRWRRRQRWRRERRWRRGRWRQRRSCWLSGCDRSCCSTTAVLAGIAHASADAFRATIRRRFLFPAAVDEKGSSRPSAAGR